MFAIGFSLTSGMIIKPLKNWKFDLSVIAANFVIVPAVVIGLTMVVPLPPETKIGLTILSLSAGGQFIPKLSQSAKGNIVVAVALMMLLMISTIIILPLVLPFVILGTSLNSWDIAKPIIFLMLTPLGIAVTIKHRYSGFASIAAKRLNLVTTASILILLLLFFVGFWSQIIGTFGTGLIAFGVFFALFALCIGYFLGGRNPGVRRVTGLATANRNLTAGMLVATTNFAETPMVFVAVFLLSIVKLVILMTVSWEWGRRNSKKEAEPAVPQP